MWLSKLWQNDHFWVNELFKWPKHENNIQHGWDAASQGFGWSAPYTYSTLIKLYLIKDLFSWLNMKPMLWLIMWSKWAQFYLNKIWLSFKLLNLCLFLFFVFSKPLINTFLRCCYCVVCLKRFFMKLWHFWFSFWINSCAVISDSPK